MNSSKTKGQTLDFLCDIENTYANNVRMEPGDGTTYSFVVTQTEKRHDWNEHEGNIVGVASVCGTMFGGQWLPVGQVVKWWENTKEGTPEESLNHHFIQWVIGEMRPGTTTNPWTVRAAFLAVLKTIQWG